MFIAVLSADCIDSTTWSIKERDLVMETLTRELKSIPDSKHEFYRGDSFQLVVQDASKSLHIAMILKTAVNKLLFVDDDSSSIQADVRISIGIGEESIPRPLIAQSDGSAYQFSGRRLDTMKGDQRTLCVSSASEDFDAEFNASLLLFEEIAKRWSVASAEAIYYSLNGYKETPLAKLLGIGQSSVNKRKKAAAWNSIEVLIKRFEQAVSKLPPGKV